MSIPYRVIKSSSTLGKKKEAYYARAIKNETIDEKQLMEILAREARISSGDCVKMILYLAEIIAEQLGKGNTVKLWDIGTLSVTLQSATVARPEDFKTAHIKKVDVNFLADKRLKKRLNSNEFTKLK